MASADGQHPHHLESICPLSILALGTSQGVLPQPPCLISTSLLFYQDGPTSSLVGSSPHLLQTHGETRPALEHDTGWVRTAQALRSAMDAELPAVYSLGFL